MNAGQSGNRWAEAAKDGNGICLSQDLLQQLIHPERGINKEEFSFFLCICACIVDMFACEKEGSAVCTNVFDAAS